jgi:hypothetical protein
MWQRSRLTLAVGSALVVWLLLLCSRPTGDVASGDVAHVRWPGGTMLLGQGALSSFLATWIHKTAAISRPSFEPQSIATAPAVKSLHVDCDVGSDSLGDGSARRPWLTPRRARDAVRMLQPVKQPVDIFIRGDCYPRRLDGAVDFTQPVLELYPNDSGSPAAPIAYRSYPGEPRARLLSGLSVPPNAWRPYNKRIWSQLGIDKRFFGGFQRPSVTDGTGLGQCNAHILKSTLYSAFI